jgi:DNA-3-methyladenine glycosylase
MADRIPDAGYAPVTLLDRAALPRDSALLAQFLLGKVLVREVDGTELSGRIVETEAYHQDDPACHAYRGMTARNRSLFLDRGFAYVYLCYGTSFMLNVSSEEAGIGSGVLLRALEPLRGRELMRRGRERVAPKDLVRGPGRLTAALRIDLSHDGLDLCRPGELWLGHDGDAVPSIGMSTRIGLTQGGEAALRYFIKGSPYVSGPRRLNAPPS